MVIILAAGVALLADRRDLGSGRLQFAERGFVRHDLAALTGDPSFATNDAAQKAFRGLNYSASPRHLAGST
ncbi:hypothetical protein SBV1_2720002 [Verrucomicrobia bacterium]|nr:hypothetical protein SBV1_2720002 [Verrucomicrobiota bacterium]